MDVQQNTTFLTQKSAWTLRLGKYIEPWVPVRQFRQLDYVAANSPAVVTLTVGGNDIRFPSIATRCDRRLSGGLEFNAAGEAEEGRT